MGEVLAEPAQAFDELGRLVHDEVAVEQREPEGEPANGVLRAAPLAVGIVDGLELAGVIARPRLRLVGR